MKSLDSYINESQQETSLGKKIIKLLDGDIVEAIKKRTDNWDANRFEWSRDPMFLIISPEKFKGDSKEVFRELEWTREKYINTFKDKIKGTIDNYNIQNDSGEFDYCVLGIFVDRQFYPIASLESFNNIIKLLQENK